MFHRMLKNLHSAENASDTNGGREECFGPTVMQHKKHQINFYLINTTLPLVWDNWGIS